MIIDGNLFRVAPHSIALPNPLRDGPWNPTFRKERERWGTRPSRQSSCSPEGQKKVSACANDSEQDHDLFLEREPDEHALLSLVVKLIVTR